MSILNTILHPFGKLQGSKKSFLQKVTTPKSVYSPKANTMATAAPANPSATSTTSPTIPSAPASGTSGLSAAGKSYASSLSKPQASGNYYDPYSGLLTDEGRTAGYAEVNAPKSVGQPPAPKTTSAPQEQNAYLDYLRSVFNPEQVATAQRAKEESLKRLADIQSRNEKQALDARVSYERTLDRPGGTLAGAQQSASVGNRRASAESAYGALEESAAGRTAQVASDIYDSYLNAGKSVYEAEQAQQKYIDEQANIEAERAAKEQSRIDELQKPYTLSEGQSRYEYNPDTGQYQKTASAPKTYAPSSSSVSLGAFSGTLSPLAQAVQNGTIPIASLSVKNRDAVAAELAQSGIPSSRQQTLQQNLSLVDSLLQNPSINAISGLPGLGVLVPGSKAQLAKNQYDQLKAILSLENREKLKGSGAISDFEAGLLSQAASALGRNLSDKQFKEQLQLVRDVFAGKYALTNALNSSQVPQTAGGSTGTTPSGITYTVSQ